MIALAFFAGLVVGAVGAAAGAAWMAWALPRGRQAMQDGSEHAGAPEGGRAPWAGVAPMPGPETEYFELAGDTRPPSR